MAGKSPAALSGREYAILKLLWERGALTVRAVRDELASARDDGDEEIPYTTVLSLLQLMEKKGYVVHQAEGKTYRYQAKVPRARTTRLVDPRFREPVLRRVDRGPADGTGRESGRLARGVGEAQIGDQASTGGER